MKDTYSEDEKIHDIILEIHNDKNEIVLYKILHLNYRCIFIGYIWGLYWGNKIKACNQ